MIMKSWELNNSFFTLGTLALSGFTNSLLLPEKPKDKPSQTLYLSLSDEYGLFRYGCLWKWKSPPLNFWDLFLASKGFVFHQCFYNGALKCCRNKGITLLTGWSIYTMKPVGPLMVSEFGKERDKTRTLSKGFFKPIKHKPLQRPKKGWVCLTLCQVKGSKAEAVKWNIGRQKEGFSTHILVLISGAKAS